MMETFSHVQSRWNQLNNEIRDCRACPRLREHCKTIAREKRHAYLDQQYWGKPVPNFGESSARILIVGLAPGAHGANRTGRMFTGDRSGLWLYRALHRAGLSTQLTYEKADDGQELIGCAISAVCHCAPPGNKPLPAEIENCQKFLERTWELLQPKVVVTLGQISWNRSFHFAKRQLWWKEKIPKFGHGIAIEINQSFWMLGSYHPSQQNTFTGKLTEPMLDSIFEKARNLRDFQH